MCDHAGVNISGSKGSILDFLQVAMFLDVFLMVAFGMRMYSRKQSLDQRPIPWISHLGQPAAAAVEAAPILSECEEMFATPPVVLTNVELTSLRDKNLPFWNVNNGPLLDGWERTRWRRAFTGQSEVRLGVRRMGTPSRKGSVLEAFMRMVAVPSDEKCRSEKSSVVVGSKVFFQVDVYSDTRRKPKKAVSRAAHNIILSSYS